MRHETWHALYEGAQLAEHAFKKRAADTDDEKALGYVELAGQMAEGLHPVICMPDSRRTPSTIIQRH